MTRWGKARASVALAAIVACASPARSDALAEVDRLMFAGVATEMCRFRFDPAQEPSKEELGRVGDAAFEQLLAELERARPGGPDNRRDADVALFRRMEATVAAAQRTITPADCPRLEPKVRATIAALLRPRP